MQLRRFIASRYSSKGAFKGQLPAPRNLAHKVATWVLLTALSIGTSGCTSIYRRTRAELPPEPGLELALRITEATEAERLTRQAGARLYNSLQHAEPGSVQETDFDRLEAAAFDLERKVLAVRDVADTAANPANSIREIDHLSNQARSWVDYVQKHRGSDAASRMRALEPLLR